MKNYLIVAIYADNRQRFAESYTAATPDDAEALAHAAANADNNELIIAGVLELVGNDLQDGPYKLVQ